MRRTTLGLLLSALFFTIGCSEPPAKERQQADEALNAARAVGAQTYAAEELTAAEAALVRYDADVAQRDYRQALNHAIEARDRAHEAARLALAQKTALVKQAETLASETRTLLNEATNRLASRTPPRNAERLRAAMRSATTAMQEARALTAKEDYRGAAKRLKDVPTALRRELGPTEPAAKPPAAKRGGTSLS